LEFKYDNEAKGLKIEVLEKVAEYSFAGTLKEHISTIPYEIIPGPLPTFRCCVYKEREIIRERLISACGNCLPNQPADKVLCVLPAACEGCPISRYRVTDNCQRCLAHRCKGACHFGAITINPKGAYIDPKKCKECGQCAAACPYNAISDTMRPCRRACPVNAIGRDEYSRTVIDYDRCISCGACLRACPFGAIIDRSQIVPIIDLLKSETPVTAVFAPAIEGQFGKATIGMIKNALKKLGFTDAVEVSLGADATAAHEAHELKAAIAKGEKLTSSCCPAFVEMVEKHFPKLAENVSSTASPMTAVARYIRMLNPKTKIVFIGPCVAKKLEIIKRKDTADYVLTFEELEAMFRAKKIDVEESAEDSQDGSRAGKNFAQSGGVAGAVKEVLKEEHYDKPVTAVRCNGSDECKKTLMVMDAGRLPQNFVEGMACKGGCIAGPTSVETLRGIKKNRAALVAKADNRTVLENVNEIHDFSKVNMTR
jgi:ferredoxin hydrogenase large subunit